jgi:hypothetical protein
MTAILRDRHRFFLVVRDIDRGDAEAFLQAADFGPHLHAELGIEVGQRLVEQQNGGLDDNRARERHTLLLPARELMRHLLLVAGKADHRQNFRHGVSDVQRSLALNAKAVGDIFEDGQMRKQRVVLENEADTAVVRLDARDIAVANEDARARAAGAVMGEPRGRGCGRLARRLGRLASPTT